MLTKKTLYVDTLGLILCTNMLGHAFDCSLLAKQWAPGMETATNNSKTRWSSDSLSKEINDICQEG